MHRSPEPGSAITSVPGRLEVLQVHDGHVIASHAQHPANADRQCRIDSAHVAGDNAESQVVGLNKLNPQLTGVDLEYLASSRLLLLGDGVEQDITLRIGAILVRKTVGLGAGSRQLVQLPVDVLLDPYIAVPDFIHSTHFRQGMVLRFNFCGQQERLELLNRDIGGKQDAAQ